MGTTTNRGYPYPEDTDLVIEGDDAIQALAEALDADLVWTASAVFPRTESPAAAGATAPVSWGAAAALVGFTYDTPTLTYTGPTRLFIVDAEVEVESGGASSLSSVVEVRLNGNAFAGSYDQVALAGGATIATRRFVHRVSTPVRIQTGESIDVTVSASPSGSLGQVGLRVYPIGPA